MDPENDAAYWQAYQDYQKENVVKMMLLCSTSTLKFRQAANEYPDLFGWLVTPRKWGLPPGVKEGQRYACDNDCYNLGDQFDMLKFLKWLTKLQPYASTCLFVPCPDKVGNHQDTLKRFYETYQAISDLGFPLAFVLQNGCTPGDVPWNLINAVFLGGTNAYKFSQEALRVLEEAGKRDVWRHIGRINSPTRINHFYNHAESFDGKYLSAFYPDKAVKVVKNHLLWRRQQLSFL